MCIIQFIFSHCRMSVDQHGNLCYSHIREPTWDVNEYLLELKSQLKSWQHVYWRLWGSINALSCARCGETFPCTQLGHCPYHTEQAQFDTGALVGSYTCCNQRTLRFDPTQTNKVGSLLCKAKRQYLCKAKRQYLLTLQVSRYCLLALHSWFISSCL